MPEIKNSPDSVAETLDSARMLRAIRVIESVCDSSLPVSISQLVQRTNIPKATLTRLVSNLVNTGYLSFVPGRRELVPGPRSARLAMRALGNGFFRRECRTILRAVVGKLGETCNLVVLDGDCVRYIERVETDAPLRMHMEPGTWAPLHCTAGGKLFLSQMEANERTRLLETLKLERKTPATFVTPTELLRELERLRKLGIGVDNEEFIAGMVGIAVPVRAADNANLVAALVCHAAAARATLLELEAMLPTLKAAAQKLSSLLNPAVTSSPT